MELIRREAIKVIQTSIRSFHSPVPGFLQGGLKVGILGSQFIWRDLRILGILEFQNDTGM